MALQEIRIPLNSMSEIPNAFEQVREQFSGNFVIQLMGVQVNDSMDTLTAIFTVEK